MTERRQTTEQHLTEETLAALAEGQDLGPEQAAAHEHLTRCRNCHAAYAEAVRFRAQWLADPGRFRVAEGSLEDGRAVRVKRPRRAAIPEPVGVPIRRRLPLLLRPLPAALAGAVLLGLLSILVVSSPFWNRANPGLRDSIAVIEPLLASSLDQGLVLPGSPGTPTAISSSPPESAPAAGPPGSAPAYRNGSGPQAPLARAVETLAERYEEGDRSAETAYWLIAGHLTTGQIQSARVIAAEARRAYPEDARLATAQGVLAYRESNLALALDLFEEALFLDPQQPEATFNRGMVRVELGDLEGARQDLHAVALREADRALGRRAARELEAIASADEAGAE